MSAKKQTAQQKQKHTRKTSNGIFNLFLFISYMTSINHLILQNAGPKEYGTRVKPKLNIDYERELNL